MSRDRCHGWGRRGGALVRQVEAKGAAEHPVMHGTASTTRSYLDQNVGSAEAEESWVRPCGNRVRKRSLRPSTLGEGDFQLVVRGTK